MVGNSKPWLKKGILTSICRKQLLYKIQFLNSNSLGKELFKTYANTWTKVKSLSKKMYYQNKIDNTITNPKIMLKILLTEIPRLILNKVEIFENDKISHYFNKPCQSN